MKPIWGFSIAVLAFLTFEPSAGSAARWSLMDNDGQLRCARGFRPDGGHRGRGPSVLGTFPSKEACEAKRLNKPLLKPVIVAVKKLKPAAVPIKKKKKKFNAPPPRPAPADDSVVH